MTERQMQLEDWLDDLCVRFIINLPQDNLTSVERICFQIEEAQWFYEDFIRPLDPNLPSYSLRSFSLRMFSHCPLLSAFAASGRHMQAFEEFLAYKNRIPVRGAIMLNDAMDATVLVKGWKKGANWSFPRGKINKDEDDLICAIREVYEETGLDLEAAGLIPGERQVKHIEINIREQQMRLYVFKNVPMDTHFEPRTRKEISKIQWWRLSDLPAFKKKNQNGNNEAAINANKFYMVAPFLVPLRKWIVGQQKINQQRAINLPAGMTPDGFLTEDDRGEESAAQAPYEVSAPESNSLEEASEALSRLLKSQPPSQGTQFEAAGVHSGLQTQNSGQALLALLQSKPSNTVPSQPPSNTPLEQIVGVPPIPNLPHHHHHHPQPPRFSEMPPPPQYPIQAAQSTFSYQGPPPQQQHLPTQVQPNPGLASNPPPRYFANPHHNQSQHLVHPQPLPPHVQKTVFAGGTVNLPMMPKPISQQPLQWNHSVANNGPAFNSQYSHLHAPAVPEVRKEAAAQLNSHSLSLLNAFKTGGSSSSISNIAGSLTPQGLPAVQTHLQELPAELSHATPTMSNQTVPPQNPQPSVELIAPRHVISAEQKSTLLDMLKSPSAQAMVPAKGFAATALPISGTPSAVELSAVEPLSSVPDIARKETAKHHPTNGKIPELNPEANLPFRAMTILARPSEKNDREEQAKSSIYATSIPSSRRHPQHAAVSKGKAPQAPTKVFAPQILKRPQPPPTKEKTSPAMPSPDLPETPASVPESRATLKPTEPVASPEHKQTLLSLFGKPAAVPSILPSPMVSRTSTIDVVSAISPANPSSRSRMGSIVSDNGPSRRGSSTPLSKANESFLLGYLDAFTGGHPR